MAAACTPITSTLFATSTSLSSSAVVSTITSTSLTPVTVPVTLAVTVAGIVATLVTSRIDTSTSLLTVVSTRMSVVPVVTTVPTATSVSICPTTVAPTTTAAAADPLVTGIISGATTSFSVTISTPSSSSSRSIPVSSSTSFSTSTLTNSAGVPTSTAVLAVPVQRDTSSGPPVGAIVGGALGGVAALAALAIVLFLCCRRPRQKREAPGDIFAGAGPYHHGARDSYENVHEAKLPPIAPALSARHPRRPSNLSHASSSRNSHAGIANWAATNGSPISPRRESFRSSHSSRPEMAERYADPAEAQQYVPYAPRRAGSFSNAGFAGVGTGPGPQARLGRQPSAARHSAATIPETEPFYDYHQAAPPSPPMAPQFADPAARQTRQRANMLAGLPAVSEAGSMAGGHQPRPGGSGPPAPSAYRIPSVGGPSRPGPPSYTTEAR